MSSARRKQLNPKSSLLVQTRRMKPASRIGNQHLSDSSRHVSHQCQLCPTTFEDTVALQYHTLTAHSLQSVFDRQEFGNKMFICNHCDNENGEIGFNKWIDYVDHMRKHLTTISDESITTIARCLLCSKTFIDQVEMQRHLIDQHYRIVSIYNRCNKCVDDNCRLNDDRLNEHFDRYHCKKLYRCTICATTFDEHSRLMNHLYRNHTTRTIIFQCAICDRSFDSDEKFVTHVKCEHLASEPSTSTSTHRTTATIKSESLDKGDVADKRLSSDCDDDDHRCYLCTDNITVFNDSRQLCLHLISHSFVGCTQFQCYLCNTIFSLPEPLHEHMQLCHATDQPYDCRHCSRRYHFRSQLDNHLHWHRSTNSKVFKSINAMQTHSHVHMITNGDGSLTNRATVMQQYRCDHCSIVFTRAHRLKQHCIKRHANDKASFQCQICDAKFIRNDTLLAHITEHRRWQQHPSS